MVYKNSFLFLFIWYSKRMLEIEVLLLYAKKKKGCKNTCLFLYIWYSISRLTYEIEVLFLYV
ncbi:MAG: hypothetical protein CO118_09750 [Flavobacteriales bacterium CG_4_9_14_3_um_filter_32_8]|nr:MAG: hypothetical protein CO118_09750 [Flavobacteriales bacterium CG_4_9_14_3_um_filter_32_8]